MNRPMIYAWLVLLPLSLVAAPARQASQPAQKASRRAAPAAQADPGERVFAANCSRCHQAPMALPSQIAGTVIMHMRVRARLSREDERLLLKFLAP